MVLTKEAQPLPILATDGGLQRNVGQKWLGCLLTAGRARMLRTIAGWVRIYDEPLEMMMQGMNQRMERGPSLHPLPPWRKQYLIK